MAETKVLDDAIKIYVDSKAEEYDDEVKEILTKNFRNEIYKEVIAKEKQKIMEEVKQERKYQLQQEEVNQLRWIVIETIILGILLGLLVNQGTDVIAYLKGNMTIDMDKTLFWILLLVILNVSFIFFVYINKLGNLLKK